jgi:hypothetical protein
MSTGLKLLQVNTDGLTIRYPRRAINEVQSVMDWWQNKTKLKLEKAVYQRMQLNQISPVHERLTPTTIPEFHFLG